jgi:ribosomal protein S18 acetylase RimI-like enzyme
MPYEFRYLSKKDLVDVYPAFVEAYSDYAVDMTYNTETGFTNRAIKNGVEFSTSVGVYNYNRMIGFTLVGRDKWNGVECAFDAMTGIIKTYRSQGIAGKMFDYVLPKLGKAGVKEFWLEVLQSNMAAMKAYTRTGFTIVRELDSFKWKWPNVLKDRHTSEEYEVRTIVKSELPFYASILDWQPSWENSFASIGRIPDEVLLLEARERSEGVGVLVYYPTLNWIMCIAVNQQYRRRGIASQLLCNLRKQIGECVSKVRLVSTDHTDIGMLQFLQKAGFERYTQQYEMKMVL